MRALIGIVGENRAGKNTFVKEFTRAVSPCSVFHLSTKEFLERSLLHWRWIEPTRANLVRHFKGMKRDWGSTVLVRALREVILSSEADFVCYDCIRVPEDLRLVRSIERSSVVYVTAPLLVRWRRADQFGDKPGERGISLRKFRCEDRTATSIHVPDLGAKADYRIVNDMVLEKGYFQMQVAHFRDFFAYMLLGSK